MTSRPPALAVRWAYRLLVAAMVAATAVAVAADEDYYYDSEWDPTAGTTTTTAPAPVSPAGPTNGTAATAGPSSQQQQPTAPPAWESGNETTLPMPGAPGVEDEAAAVAAASRFQPRVTVVSGLPSYHGIQSISNPGGTPWCRGAPTFWVTGHESGKPGRPHCLVDGKWAPSNLTRLIGNPDRHACVTMDVNRDGLPDIACTIGAGSGRGEGFTQLFMTLPNGTLSLVGNAHGLQKYPTMRNRVAVALKNKRGVREYLFMGTQGSKRKDGRSNLHRMFRNVYSAPGRFPYFVEVPGPWAERLFPATCAVAGDFSGDGQDDLIVCNPADVSLLARKVGTGHGFVKVALPSRSPHIQNWGKVRLADVTGDGRKDLVVLTSSSIVLVFKGQAASPYFDFFTPYYKRAMPFSATDVEVLDVNQDGRPDLYVSLVNSAKGQFCGPHGRVVVLPKDVIPPRDRAQDILLLGNARQAASRFTPVTMQHSLPGCGSFVERWDGRTMLLSQGGFNHPGYHLLLEW